MEYIKSKAILVGLCSGEDDAEEDGREDVGGDLFEEAADCLEIQNCGNAEDRKEDHDTRIDCVGRVFLIEMPFHNGIPPCEVVLLNYSI